LDVKADVHGALVPSANPVDLGLMRVGNENEGLIRLNRTDGKKIEIKDVELTGFQGAVKLAPCKPKSADCLMLRIAVSDKQVTGSVKGKLLIKTPNHDERLEVDIWGLLVPKDFKIQTLDTSKNAPSSSVVKGDSENIGDVLRSSVSNAHSIDIPVPSGNGPLLKWTVSNSAQVYGFQIYRAFSEDGAYLKINKGIYRSITEGNEAINYQWRDVDVESGKSYWYKIVAVKNDDTKEMLGHPLKAVAK